MKTREYLLDTHIVVWLLNNNERLDRGIRENIEYFQHQYHVSPFSLLEIVHLQQLGKIELKKSYSQIEEMLKALNIAIEVPSSQTFCTLEKIPFLKINGSKHGDMIDRYLIADAIANDYTLISADSYFPQYRCFGLTLVEN